jgi:sulfur-carrier protein
VDGFTVKINVRYFASLREALGSGEVVEVLPASTLHALREALIARGGEHAARLARTRPVRCALDQSMVEESATLREGCEVAFFPPVTGG